MLASATSPPVTTSSTGSMAAGTNASSSESRVSPPTADLDSLKRPDKLSSDLSRKKRRYSAFLFLYL